MKCPSNVTRLMLTVHYGRVTPTLERRSAKYFLIMPFIITFPILHHHRTILRIITSSISHNMNTISLFRVTSNNIRITPYSIWLTPRNIWMTPNNIRWTPYGMRWTPNKIRWTYIAYIAIYHPASFTTGKSVAVKQSSFTSPPQIQK